MQRDTRAETQAFFDSREQQTLERGSQLPYFSKWGPNNSVNGHGVHYTTYAFQARHGTDAYRLFSQVESLLQQHGIRPQPAKWVHGSAFSISRELHLAPKAAKTTVDVDPGVATRIERKAAAYCASAKPFSLEFTGRLVLMPNTLTYEVADFGPYLDFLDGLWKAVPEFASMKVHPKDPTKSPVTDPDGAAALFQAAYGTNAYEFEDVRAVAGESLNLKGATLEVSRIHRLWHTISSDRSDGVSVPAADLTAAGSENAPTHWASMPTKIIEMNGAEQSLGASR